MPEFRTIGIVHSPYKQKFAVPRQPDLASLGYGELRLIPPYNQPEAVKGLEQFSHIWLLFLFHKIVREKWKPTVRPPRLGGNRRLGVFATRSTYRPNLIGLSLVELKEIIYDTSTVILKLGSVDLVDCTPIIDIKPYIPYCDSKPDAQAGYAQFAPKTSLHVIFTESCKQQLTHLSGKYPQLQALITQVLSQDPRPAYHKGQIIGKTYAIYLYDLNIKWYIDKSLIIVYDIALISC